MISTLELISVRLSTPCFSNIAIFFSLLSSGIASTVLLRFKSPRLSASFSHSSEYPSPLKIILPFFSTTSLIIALTSALKSFAFSSLVANSSNTSATIVLIITLVSEIEEAEPNILNSNLLPVKANGDVLLRSVLSLRKAGIISEPIFILIRSVLS